MTHKFFTASFYLGHFGIDTFFTDVCLLREVCIVRNVEFSVSFIGYVYICFLCGYGCLNICIYCMIFILMLLIIATAYSGII